MFEIIKDFFVGLAVNFVQNRIDGKKPQMVVNINIGQLDKLIILNSDQELLEGNFRPLYDWLKSGNAESFILEVGKSSSQQFVNYWDKIKDSKILSPGQMIEFFENIRCGSLNWMIRESIDGQKVSDYLKRVETVSEKSIDKQFFEVAKKVAIENDPDLKEIEDSNLESINIGGLVALLRTNGQFTNREVLHPKFIGFKKVENKDALVNLARKRIVSILNVRLKKSERWEFYDVILEIKNNTDDKIEFYIPKGQIFENKELNNDTQNLTTKDEDRYVLDGFEENEFVLKSFCLNKKLSRPTEEGTEGNITIFEAGEKSFTTQTELWNMIAKNKNRLQFAKF